MAANREGSRFIHMAHSSDPPTWQDIEKLLDELLDLPVDAREKRLEELDAQAPDYALAARKALSAASKMTALDGGLDGVADKLLLDLLEKETSSAIGSELSVYRLDEVIGRGGMGVVYRASRIDGQFEQQVAIKKMPFGLTGKRGIERFQEERTILASVRHPFIGQLLDGGLDDEGLPYLIMELIDGGVNIDRYVEAQDFSEKQTLNLFKRVCNAVSFLHRNLITHGDIKPSNILIRLDGHPKLIDFGISKLATRDSAKPIRLHGATPGYAPPEQARGDVITTQTDIYALGATLDAILTSGQPEAVHLSLDLRAIIANCKQELPEHRYVSVEALTADLDAYLLGYPVKARSGESGYKAGKYLRRNWIPVLAASVVVISLVSGIVFSINQAAIAKQEAQRATVISEFLISMFEQSADAFSSDSDPTLYDLVEAADARLDTELQDAPAIKADLQEIFGMAYDGLLKDTAKAKGHFADVLAYDREYDPDNIPRIISMLGWIAETLRKEGDYEGANKIIDEAIEIDLRDGEPDMIGWMTKAHVAAQIGTAEESQWALDMAEKVFARDYGSDSNEMAVVQAARGLAASAQGDIEHGIELLKIAIALRERNGGGKWVSTDRMRTNVGVELHVLGQYQQAAEIYEQVIKNKEERLGSDHPDLVADLNNIGALYNDLGNTATGLTRLERGVSIARTEMKENNFHRIAVELNFARGLIWAGNVDDALSLLTDLERRAREAVGEEHALTTVVQRDRAWAMLDIGDIKSARTTIDIASPKLKLLPRRAIAAKIDAEIAIVEGNYQRAESSAAQSLADFQTSEVTRPWMSAEARLLQDKILVLLDREVDAARQQKDKTLLLQTMSEGHRALRLVQ